MKRGSMYAIDIIYCLVFLPLMIFILPVERYWGSHPQFLCVFVLWLYLIYFTVRYLLVPKFFTDNKWRLYDALILIASIVVTSLFASYDIRSPYYGQIQYFTENTNYQRIGIRLNQQAVWIHFIMVICFSSAVGFLVEINRQRHKGEQLEYERNKAELSLVKAQINPHFLFNTLNSLYGLLITNSEKGVESLERFINIVKYMHNSASQDYISIVDEVQYISQYIELQKLRLNEHADVKFEVQLLDNKMVIAPMILITFVENAFKYGISADEPCYVHVDLKTEENRLNFTVENTIFGERDNGKTSMGIENCKRRLELLYHDNYELKIEQKNNKFCVDLNLLTQNYD